MHDDEADIDVALVRRLLARDRPDLTELPLTRLEHWGTDHAIFRVGDHYSARLPRIGWAAAQGERERRWLPALAPHLPAMVPVPEYVGRPGFGYPFRWYLAPWIDAVSVEPDTTDLTGLATDLAGFVVALESVEADGGPVVTAGHRGGPLHAADTATVDSAERLRGETDVAALLAVWRAGVEAPPWAGAPRWVHGDLTDGNLLLRDGRLAGVIDWGGLTSGDPAVELMIAWSLFDAPARAAYRRELGFVDDAMWLRGRAWAVSAAVNALPYYRDTNPDIVARSWRCVRAVLSDRS